MRPRPVKPEGLSAPGLVWRQRSNGWTASWVARKDIVARGYSLKSARLWPPSEGGQPTAPDADEWRQIGLRCTRLQDEMLSWANDRGGTRDPRTIYDGSMASLIDVFQQDADSPFQELRHHTRRRYVSVLRSLHAAVGTSHIPSLTFRDFKRWHEKAALPKLEGGRPRPARAHSFMTFVRIVIGFGFLCRLAGCEEAKKTLAEMEFAGGGKKRTVFITAPQAVAIRTEAHRRGLPSIALAQALMFELMLRQKDVIGEWVPVSEPGLSEITWHMEKWLVGLRWEEVSPDLILTHRLSKSLRGRRAIMDPEAGKTEPFDLRAYPMVVEELAHVPPERRSGPVIVFENTGLPWDHKYFQTKWRRIATAAGVPANVQNRDSRSGGITEGRRAGATIEDLRHHAGHSLASTTAGYDRAGIEDKNKVAQLRVKSRPAGAK